MMSLYNLESLFSFSSNGNRLLLRKSLPFLFSFFFSLIVSYSEAQTIKVLFDASKAESAGNADWVVDANSYNIGFGSGPAVLNSGNEANAQSIPSPTQSNITGSTSETYWSGALSYWGIDCVNRNYIVESLPYNGQITYGNSGNLQDLSNYDVFIVCEPNILFTAIEKTAILNFVANGGGLFMVADHTISDRNNDGEDSPFIWNDLMTNNSVQSNPFGITFDLVDFSQTTSNIPSLPSDSILHGPAGNVTQVQFAGGTSMTLDPVANSTVEGVVYKTGSSFGNSNVMVAYARYGSGKVAAIGDSSPCDDGTGDSNDGLFFGYTGDAAGNHRKLLMNATIWLATPTTVTAPVADFTANPLAVCLGLSNTFTNTSTGSPTSYSWNFGSGASPATATTVGPHTVTYSSAGLKTISLTVSNSGGSNTVTKVNYVEVDGNCSTEDVGVLSLLSPASMSCPATGNSLQVRIKNYGATAINFSTSPVDVQIQITDPVSTVQSFTQTISSGSLAANSTMDVTFSGAYDMTTSGNYVFNSTTILASDVNPLNDGIIATNISVGPGYQSDFILFSENMGIVSTTTAISSHETNNGFQNTALTFSGTADIRITTFSTGYPNASGNANVFFTGSGRNFIISGINSTTFNNLQLSLGIYKNIAGSTGSDMLVQVSTDGTNYTNLTMPALPAGTAWNYRTLTGTIPSTPNLRIKFTTTSATQFRIDDISLVEQVTVPIISASGPVNFCQGSDVTLSVATATSYLWSNGMTTQSIVVNTSGNYSVVVSNASGCTATTVPVSVSVDPVYSTTLVRYIAQGSSYTLPNLQTVSTTGMYPVSYQTILGCDSTIITDLRVVVVNDNDLCTTDACNLLTGAVSHVQVNTDDGNPCTIDGCNPLSGVYHILISEICGNGIDDNCNGQIDEGCSVTLNLKVLISGFYIGNNLLQPAIDPVNFPTVCDTIIVELHSNVSPYAILYSDKKTINVSGNGVFNFPSAVLNGSFYIVVKHRNTIETWSSAAVSFAVNPVTYNFSNAVNKAFGNNLKFLETGVYGIYNGDIDKNNVINTTDLSAVESNSVLFLTGYIPSDVTGNGIVESSDQSVVENNIGITLLRP